jgi:hypothetical protein
LSCTIRAAVCSLFFLCWPFAATAAPDSARSHLRTLLEAAEQRRLHEEPRWLALVHYEPAKTPSGVESLVSGGEFFLSPTGKTSPRDELAATLAAFFDPTLSTRGEQHPQCAFRARFLWLSRELEREFAMAASTLPAVTCERYDTWVAGMDPRGLTFVLPEAYMNNPASMFSHTLLRIDGGESAGDRDLLAYAINFAAETGGDGGAPFAVKGIFGMYPGYFSVMPYYEKVRQYGDWENRDIWEYPVDLAPDELALMIAHVWEMLGVPFVYYFFDENCSYQLLALLEVARPGLRLTPEYPAWVIPVDTLRTVAEREGLLGESTYRASPATRIRYGSSNLSGGENRLARDIAHGRVAVDADSVLALEPTTRVEVLSLAYTYLRYLYLGKDVTREESAPRSRKILIALSEVEGGEPPREPPVPRTRPEDGHPIARFGFGAGVRDDEPFVEVSMRAAFHSLTDPTGGYLPGANLDLVRSALRFEPERNVLRIEEIALLDVRSLTPRDAFLRPISWTFGTGLHTRLLSDGSGDGLDPDAVGYLRGSAGLAYEPLDGLLVYGLTGVAIEAAPALDHDYAVGPSGEVGVIADLLDARSRTHFSVEALPYLAGDTTTSGRASVEQRITLSSRAAIVLDVGVEHAYGETRFDGMLSLRAYFRNAWADS